jgi:amidohydrolase
MGMTIVATDVAGHGILARMGSGERRILVRSDMDALPSAEQTGVEYAANTGAHHACGHDGHMTMLLGALEILSKNPPCEIWALFQPAEEIGEGMPRCLEHADFPGDFDACLAIHNVPGIPLGHVLIRSGVACLASTGISFAFQGVTSHAAEPKNGRNPIPTVGRLIARIERAADDGDEHAVVALVQLGGGGPTFGTSAGDALVAATLRAGSDESLAAMIDPLVAAAQQDADANGLQLEVNHIEPFPATINHEDVVRRVKDACTRADLDFMDPGPFPWSEDFGHATSRWPGALVGLGSGENQPALHRPDYDFPDALIEPGVKLWTVMVEALA